MLIHAESNDDGAENYLDITVSNILDLLEKASQNHRTYCFDYKGYPSLHKTLLLPPKQVETSKLLVHA